MWASQPQHFFETCHLLQQWPRAPAYSAAICFGFMLILLVVFSAFMSTWLAKETSDYLCQHCNSLVGSW